MNVFSWRLLGGLGFVLVAGHLGVAQITSPTGAYAQVKSGVGSVKLNGKILKSGDLILQEGLLETGARSKCQISFTGKEAVLSLGENTSLMLMKPNPDSLKGYEFKKGICAWKVSKLNPKKKWIRVTTQTSALGVRGTSFVTKFNPALGESEVVVYEGLLELSAAADTDDKVEVSEGEWGGIGGRFGEKVHKIKQLPLEVLQSFKVGVDL